MENEHGRSRVYAQWLDTEEKIQASIGEGLLNHRLIAYFRLKMKVCNDAIQLAAFRLFSRPTLFVQTPAL
jgi:hypothetical protein